MTLPQLVASIDAERRRGSNLSSAIRLFVLDFYRRQIPVRKRPDTAKT
jgi:predicted DNA-binding ribbon-helix-helix protein